MALIEHWIGGSTTAGTSTRRGPVFNPATGEQQHEVVLAETADAVVSVVRDLAQDVYVAGRAPAGAPALHAQSGVQLLSGRPDLAITTLIRAGALR